jgi:hypothetical protein
MGTAQRCEVITTSELKSGDVVLCAACAGEHEVMLLLLGAASGTPMFACPAVPRHVHGYVMHGPLRYAVRRRIEDADGR